MTSNRRVLAPALLATIAAFVAHPTLAQDRPTLALSLDDAVQRALENNVDLKVQSFNPEFSAQAVRAAEGYYDTFGSATTDYTSSSSPARNAFSGATQVETKTANWNLGLNQAIKTGGSLSLSFENNRQSSNSVYSTFNPVYSSGLTVALKQPLLRNFTIDSARRQLRVSKKNKEISDIQLRQTVTNTVATVKKSYLDLMAAINNLESARKNLDLAKKLLGENEIRVKVGTMAPLDVVEARSEVARQESGVIIAESLVESTQDVLKRQVYPTNKAEFWAMRIVPTDRPSTAEASKEVLERGGPGVDVNAALAVAFNKRADIVATKLALERADVDISYARNQTLPDVSLTASYNAGGVGGPILKRDELGGPVIETIPGGYSDALSNVTGIDYPTWYAGVTISYPFRNRSARAALAQSQINKDQSLASLRRLELQIAAEVRGAARDVETGFKSVAATQAARVLAGDRLDAEQKKFAAGMSTNFLVTQAQRDLAAAETSELQAVLNYRKSLIEFDRVQEAGVGQ